jgi:cobalt-zinc-cadmium efflux system membrane fusion protein
VLALVAAASFFIGGCGQQGSKKSSESKSAQDEQKAAKKPHDHSDWWCAEHGVPEDMCSMCSEKVAAEYKKKGDWCKKHDRAQSQCFKCNPKLKEKFAAMYRAKYGKEPPPIEEKMQ